jgi:hypothetical protein
MYLNRIFEQVSLTNVTGYFISMTNLKLARSLALGSERIFLKLYKIYVH